MEKERTPLISGNAPASDAAAYPTDYPTGYPTGYPPSGYPTGYPPNGGYQGYPPATPLPPNYTTDFGAAPPPSALPPQFAAPLPNASGMMVVPCRVCAQPIEYTAKPGLSAVRCNKCHSGTQVGPPPPGKKFILCQCNALLTVNNNARSATCPKPDCKRALILAPELPGKKRAFCSHCSCLLSYSAASAVVICPKCRGRSVVNRSKLNYYCTLFFALAFIFIGLGIALTISSFDYAEQSGGGTYYVWWGFIVFGVCMLIRAGMYAGLNYRANDASIIPV